MYHYRQGDCWSHGTVSSRRTHAPTGTLASPSPSMGTTSLLALARGPQLSSAFYFKTSSNLHLRIPLCGRYPVRSNLGRIHGRAMSRLMIQDKPDVVRTEIRSSQPGKINRKAALNSLHPCEPRRRRRVLDPSFSDSALCHCHLLGTSEIPGRYFACVPC
ncbi:hypothetical protein GGI43DRAFT_140106 [Trichoderma evansii]